MRFKIGTVVTALEHQQSHEWGAGGMQFLKCYDCIVCQCNWCFVQLKIKHVMPLITCVLFAGITPLTLGVIVWHYVIKSLSSSLFRS